MTEIPIKTRQRILRKARLRISQGENTLICKAIKESDIRFQYVDTSRVYIYFPEIKKRRPKIEPLKGLWFNLDDKVSRINLLSDAINELNEKIKEESGLATGVDQDGRRKTNRTKASYHAK